MKYWTLLFFLTFSISLFGQSDQKEKPSEQKVSLKTKKGEIHGSLMMPANTKKPPVVLLISGSGPTNRNGNSPAMVNNNLKMIANSLAQNGIASLRYDKRGIGASKAAGSNESKLRFEHYIEDAHAWVKWLKKQKTFGKIHLIGHSEGALIGSVVAQEAKIGRFVAIAGASKSADHMIREQLKAQPADILTKANPIIDSLAQGHMVKKVDPLFSAFFRASIQPYVISWFKYDPSAELAKVKRPVLIIQGTTDLQVSVEDAKSLAAAQPKAQVKVIEGMNHVLKTASIERSENIAVYNKPDIPLTPELMESILPFLKG